MSFDCVSPKQCSMFDPCRTKCASGSAGQGHDELTDQLLMMGFDAHAIQASKQATSSNDVGVLIDWLHSNATGRGQRYSVLGMPASGPSSAPNPRYPVPQFTDGHNPLRSHPVPILQSLDDDPEVAIVYNPHRSHQAASHAAIPSHASGMEAIVAAKRATASRIGQDLQSGLRDLQVPFPSVGLQLP